MALIFLGVGIVLAVWGLRSTYGKNMATALTAATVLMLILLAAGAPIPGELILIAIPTWAVTLMQMGRRQQKAPKNTGPKNKDGKGRGDGEKETWYY